MFLESSVVTVLSFSHLVAFLRVTLYRPRIWCKNCYELETNVRDERRSRMWGMPTHQPAPLPACVDLPLITPLAMEAIGSLSSM